MLLLLSHVSIIYQRADNLGHPISQNFMVATFRGDLPCTTAHATGCRFARITCLSQKKVFETLADEQKSKLRTLLADVAPGGPTTTEFDRTG